MVLAMNRVLPIEDMPPVAKGRGAAFQEPAPEGLAFDAVLTPNRSLPNAGFAAVMAIVISANLLFGAYFFAIGAWPVIGFMGLDVLLVWAAFRLSYRQGRLSERVAVDEDEIRVSRVLPSGHETRWRLQTAWARVVIDRRQEHEVDVRLVSKGRSLRLGSFLSPQEREAFGDALADAMKRAVGRA
jgi:uncharacterized membrane protein